MFVTILALTAFVIAGAAAYFSVQGIATLYAGAYMSVLIMAGSLEMGKIVATSFLYRYWHKTNVLLKTYILIAIITLMGITSMGIFGFLTAAYQTSLIEYSQAETQQEFLTSQNAILKSELESLNNRVETLNQSRLSQEQRLPSMSRTAAKPVYEDIARSAEEIAQTRARMNEIFAEIKALDEQTLQAQKQSGKQKDIGTLKYAAELFNTDINTIVKWFTLSIIFVFDPLAIALILAYNIAANRNFKEDDVVEEKSFVHRFLNRKAKYRN